jgi:hypothetical protein
MLSGNIISRGNQKHEKSSPKYQGILCQRLLPGHLHLLVALNDVANFNVIKIEDA